MKEPFTFQTSEMMWAANLMAHPAAGVMAFSALGFGMASHVIGSWIGAVSATAEVSQRFWQPLMQAAPAVAVKPVPAAPEPRAKQDVPAMLEKVKSFAKAPVPARPAKPAATVVSLRKPAKEAAPAVEVSPAAAPVSTPVADAAPSAPARMEKPERADDLKAISGIGPKLEQVLNGLGIWTYAQIAAWSEKETAWVDDFLGFKGRIGRDGWIGQASALADGAKTASGAKT